jgi:hypothetical protein
MKCCREARRQAERKGELKEDVGVSNIKNKTYNIMRKCKKVVHLH